MRDRTKKILTGILTELGDIVSDVGVLVEANLLCFGSVSNLARKLNFNMTRQQYYSSMQSIRRNGYIKKINENQFLITPKGIKKARRTVAENISFDPKKWDGRWFVVIFDIPNDLGQKRNLFRGTLLRLGFLGIQKSVYVSPCANFKELAYFRDEIGISKYVTFITGKISEEENDSKLRKKFRL